MWLSTEFPPPARERVDFRQAITFAAQRRPPRPSDVALDAGAERWLRTLAPGRRPYRLATLFPRVANRLALCAGDREMFLQALDDLLTDRRGGRRGFPAQVVRELKRLR